MKKKETGKWGKGTGQIVRTRLTTKASGKGERRGMNCARVNITFSAWTVSTEKGEGCRGQLRTAARLFFFFERKRNFKKRTHKDVFLKAAFRLDLAILFPFFPSKPKYYSETLAFRFDALTATIGPPRSPPFFPLFFPLS